MDVFGDNLNLFALGPVVRSEYRSRKFTQLVGAVDRERYEAGAAILLGLCSQRLGRGFITRKCPKKTTSPGIAYAVPCFPLALVQ